MCAGHRPSFCHLQRENKDGDIAPLLMLESLSSPTATVDPTALRKSPQMGHSHTKAETDKDPELLLGDADKTLLAFRMPSPGGAD